MNRPYIEVRNVYKRDGVIHWTPSIYTVNDSMYYGLYFSFLNYSIAIFLDK